MPPRTIRWPGTSRVTKAYYPKVRRIRVTLQEVEALVASGDVVAVSYTRAASDNWKSGVFRFRNRRSMDTRRSRPGEHVIEDIGELFQVFEEKWLEVYRVEGHDYSALHVGNSDAYRTLANPRGIRGRLKVPHAPRETA
jgi:hypothetical protein